jgi:hypothetical protein
MPPTTLKNPNQQVPQEMVDKLNFLKGEVAKLAKTTPVNKIPAGSLNTTPFTPPTPITSTTYKGNLASNIALNSPTADEIKQFQTTQTSPTDQKQVTLDRINQIIGMQGGRQSETLKLQEDVGLQQKREALNKANIAQLRLDQAYEKEVKEIQKNAQGSLDIGVKQRLGDAESRYLDKKADLAIDRLASQGDVETALAIVEDKIKAKYEPLENELKTLQTYYSLYQDDLTESQKVKLQQEFQTKQQALDFQREKEMVDYQARVKAKYDTSAGVSTLSGVGGLPLSNITDSGKPMTDTQATAYGYANRLVESNNVIDSIGNKFVGAKSYLGQILPNILKTDERQQFEQAQRNFINAVLRKESGAVISPEEFANAKQQYFPQAGDSQAVLEQKKRNRETVINNFYRQAGKSSIQQTQSITRPEDLRSKYNY